LSSASSCRPLCLPVRPDVQGGDRAEIQRWPCGYTARCSVLECRRRATMILRYLDNQERPDRQTEACDTHASGLSAALKVIDRRRRAGQVAQ